MVILASNASEPPMDGGSLRSLAFRSAFERLGLQTIWIGRERTNLPGHLVLRAPRSKNLAALRTIFRDTSYLLERQVGRDWRNAVRAAAKSTGDKAPVWVNFVWNVPEWTRHSPGNPLYIDTHNSEREWFTNLARASRNPLIRRICANSIRFAEGIVTSLPTSATCVHVSSSDLNYYRSLAPACRHVVVPNGCMEYDQPPSVRRSGPVRLYFLGSLGVRMNEDALINFSRQYWPQLVTMAEFTVFGSNPSPGVVALCHEQGWRLEANLEETQLNRALADFDALVLPFDYGAGSKLKLYDALARGKCVISTPEGITGVPAYPATVLVRAKAEEWREAVQNLPLGNQGAMEKSAAFARQYTWPRLIEHFLRDDPGVLGKTFRDAAFLGVAPTA